MPPAHHSYYKIFQVPGDLHQGNLEKREYQHRHHTRRPTVLDATGKCAHMGLIAKAAAVCNSVAAIITLQKRIIGNKWSNETMRKKRIFYNPCGKVFLESPKKKAYF
jgi:hypothetical protein